MEASLSVSLSWLRDCVTTCDGRGVSHDTCHAASREVMMNVGGSPLGVYKLSRRVISDYSDPGNCL